MAVYFIRAGESGPVKIGCATDVAARFRELQCGNHETLSLLRTIEGGSREERLLHRQFASVRLRGEWFRIDAATVEAIQPPAVTAQLATETRLPELQRAVDLVGSQSKLAAIIGVPQQSVSYWLAKAQRLPAEHAKAIETATGGAVTRHELRPDIFGRSAAA